MNDGLLFLLGYGRSQLISAWIVRDQARQPVAFADAVTPSPSSTYRWVGRNGKDLERDNRYRPQENRRRCASCC